MNLEFIELDLDWPFELSVFDLRNYILSKLMEYGEPLRWAITSVSNHPEKKIQIISVEVILIINQNKETYINSELNSL
ncbi:hypothetical protein [Prochlorococcus marinus]|uniref:hypothetical protein n=1 Tax=Prochlorococcus marinus TaxID=1219 RepID=UPI0022B3D7D0|nr:hypothetical protein [Prochlorococcus marinus]